MELTTEERNQGVELTFEFLKVLQQAARLKVSKKVVLKSLDAAILFVNDVTDWE